MDARGTLEEARAAYGAKEWHRAHDLLRAVDSAAPLAPEDLELFASTARWSGRTLEVITALERAFAAYLSAGARADAARVALELSSASSDAAQPAIAAGWWARGRDLLEGEPECGAHALLEWLRARVHGDRGDHAEHEAAARSAYEIACRTANRGVEALALVDLGHAAAARGRTDEAVGLVGQALAMAVTGEIGLLETGLVYCQAVSSCRAQGEWSRACEWTEAIDRWIEREQVGYFPGLCRIHRSEVARHRGSLDQAEAEALEAVRLLGETIPRWQTLAYAELGEVRRRRGDLEGALGAFQGALERGWEPQPGLALLLVEQGDAAEAHRSLERFVGSSMCTWIAADHANLWKALVEAALAAGNIAAAERALARLEDQAAQSQTPWDRATALHAAGRLALERGDVDDAIAHLRGAKTMLAEMDAPYELASTGALLGQALRRHGDAFVAALELGAARSVFERIGARRAAARVASLLEEHPTLDPMPAPTPAPATRPRSARFVRSGDVWTLGLGELAVSVKDGRGPRYIAALLAAPGVEILAADLAGRTGRDPARDSVDPGDGGGEDGERRALAASDAGELLDGQARRAYEARVRELRAEIADAEARGAAEAAEAARSELEMIARELAQAIGLGGRHRRAGSSNERARQSVTKAIRATIRRVADHDAALGRTLETTIRTGTFCCYHPDPRHPLTWQL